MRILISLISFIGLLQVNAQGVITAEVIDKKTNNPVEFANIRVFNKSDSTVIGGGFSDANGFIRVEDIPNG